MKKCPHCAEEIQDEARVCRYCQRDVVAQLDPLPKDTPVKKSNAGKWVLLFLLGMVVLSWAVRGAKPANQVKRFVDAQREAADSAAVSERLELLASSGIRSDGGDYMRVEGQVKNISDQPIDAIVVVTSWYSDDGTFIASDKGMVDFRPLLSGQTSPFSSLTRRNPVMSKYSVAFTTFGGATIGFKDSRK